MKILMTGNEAAARGAYEAGVSFAAAYPGTPSTEILENMAQYKSDVIAEWAPNEKVALESAIGASVAGARALASMKHVGVNVAADPLFTYAYTGVNGGLVLVTADEPSMHSSQNEQDNRLYAKFAKVPLIEPSDSEESRTMMKAAFEISERFDVPVLFRMTTRICHGKGVVGSEERTEVGIKLYEKSVEKFGAVPAVCRKLRVSLEQRLKALESYANETWLNTIEWQSDKSIQETDAGFTASGNDRVGIITSGASYQYVKEVFGEKVSILKLGMSYPLPMAKIRSFAAQVEALYVVEELEPFIEDQIKAAGISCVGKEILPNIGELSPEILSKVMLNQERKVLHVDKSDVVERPPSLCAGCPHRGVFLELGKRKDLMVAGDIGCYGLGIGEPYKALHTIICMGASISMAHGAQKVFSKHGDHRKVVAVIGDSTFFHTGMNSLLDTVYNKGNTLTFILDNRITGMTGHQENPGSGFTLQEEPTTQIDIETLVKALGVKQVKTINPLKLEGVKEALDWGLEQTEPTVIITRWPCVLKKHSEQDLREFGHYKGLCRVEDHLCVGCRLCTKSGCPAVTFDNDLKKAFIDHNQCVGCEICAQICPKKAIAKEGA